ncbi:hypothetical protein DPMN_096842 [Dreissena polymorpha]|uniref:Uncharacterized protein n=1 Tax=Dreissena polymorpha TaxID=45954 RepID=A0A9D4LA52_DREPO|nr:hypothetical protein DPMN_096842 [Dreissena polymorpha]
MRRVFPPLVHHNPGKDHFQSTAGPPGIATQNEHHRTHRNSNPAREPPDLPGKATRNEHRRTPKEKKPGTSTAGPPGIATRHENRRTPRNHAKYQKNY